LLKATVDGTLKITKEFLQEKFILDAIDLGDD
jgi:hypothetical protein